MDTQQENNIRTLFRLSVILKGAHAVIEMVGGFLALVIAPATITMWLTALSDQDWLPDSNDFVATHLLTFAQHISVGSQRFAAWYLLSHGVVKIVLVIALLREKLWAYPTSLVVLGLFIAYQVYRYTFTHSLGLILLTVFDLIVMWFIWKEYRIIEAHLKG